MQHNLKLIRCIEYGLLSLFLIMWLTACAQAPQLQAVYISTPVTANLGLLCNPTIPLPPQKMLGADLDAYALALHDQIKECAAQQDEYRKDIERLLQKSKRRNSP